MFQWRGSSFFKGGGWEKKYYNFTYDFVIYHHYGPFSRYFLQSVLRRTFEAAEMLDEWKYLVQRVCCPQRRRINPPSQPAGWAGMMALPPPPAEEDDAMDPAPAASTASAASVNAASTASAAFMAPTPAVSDAPTPPPPTPEPIPILRSPTVR